MNRESLLAVATLVVVIGAVTTLALAGAVSDPADSETAADVEPAGHVSLTEITISADEVTGGTATLAVDTHLEHRGDPAENVTVVHRATDTGTGLVENTTKRSVRTLDDDGEIVVSDRVSIPRESSYEIETFVYRDGTRTESASRSVDGVDALTPAYADTDVEFHRFGGSAGGSLADVPAIGYSIASTTDDTATLEVDSYLTNTGDDTESDLELEVSARQADSNVVADTATVDLSAIDPGKTALPTVELEVPQDYDYYLDAVLWRDGTIVGTNRAVANLGPGSLSVNETGGDGGLEVSDFEGGSDRAADDGAAGDGYSGGDDSSADGTPGFGVGVAVVALLATLALTRRYQ
jgi:PGF-CTERM protein